MGAALRGNNMLKSEKEVEFSIPLPFLGSFTVAIYTFRAWITLLVALLLALFIVSTPLRVSIERESQIFLAAAAAMGSRY